MFDEVTTGPLTMTISEHSSNVETMAAIATMSSKVMAPISLKVIYYVGIIPFINQI
jgi:hypothetical protein